MLLQTARPGKQTLYLGPRWWRLECLSREFLSVHNFLEKQESSVRMWGALLVLAALLLGSVSGSCARAVLPEERGAAALGKPAPFRREEGPRQPRVFRTNSTADDATVHAWVQSVIRGGHTRRRLGYDMRSIKKWVVEHNKERRKHFKDGALVWDKKVARFAQAHGVSITHNANCSPDFNEDNQEYGENLYWAVYEHGQEPWSITECVHEWARQGKKYNYEENTCAEGEDCAAYLQVVWKETTRMGCGEVFCPYHGDFKGVAQFFVCNYTPAANLTEGHPRPY